MGTFQFKLPPAAYMPGGIAIKQAATYEESLAEYTRARRAIEKRIRRLDTSEFAHSDYVEKYRHLFSTKPSEIKSAAELSARLSDARRFLLSPRGSLSGERKMQTQTLKTLHQHGYTFVNKENLRAFGDFMEAQRQKLGVKKLQASDRVAEIYDAATRKAIPPDELMKDFDYWVKNVEALNESRVTKSKAGASAAVYKKNIEARRRYHDQKAAGRVERPARKRRKT